jgi:hypothetical protein
MQSKTSYLRVPSSEVTGTGPKEGNWRRLDKAGGKVSQPGDVVLGIIEQFCGSVTTDETMQEGAETMLLGLLGASFFVTISGTIWRFFARPCLSKAGQWRQCYPGTIPGDP